MWPSTRMIQSIPGGITAATVPGDPDAVAALVWLLAIIPGVLIVVGGLAILTFPQTSGQG